MFICTASERKGRSRRRLPPAPSPYAFHLCLLGPLAFFDSLVLLGSSFIFKRGAGRSPSRLQMTGDVGSLGAVLCGEGGRTAPSHRDGPDASISVPCFLFPPAATGRVHQHLLGKEIRTQGASEKGAVELRKCQFPLAQQFGYPGIAVDLWLPGGL